jgi:hypothetical protein
MLFTEDMLRSDFSALDVIELKLYEGELDERPLHEGPAALVGMVAVKKSTI